MESGYDKSGGGSELDGSVAPNHTKVVESMPNRIGRFLGRNPEVETLEATHSNGSDSNTGRVTLSPKIKEIERSSATNRSSASRTLVRLQ
ncbi:hypothetical protein SAMN05421858_0071 [Haladaptatus litoreus]|uniref:Uncharacterized protein n=1 Tax=Haladaptatus litoreus TaxID=553468 RepID=A0A1N6URV6_9EURY|nr:hypothetical protein SAMN05421858_0071 [Haladaptatus litoreus]